MIDLIRFYLSRGNSLIKRHILKQTAHNIPQSPGWEMNSDSDVLHIKQSYLLFLQEQMSEVLLVKLVKLWQYCFLIKNSYCLKISRLT